MKLKRKKTTTSPKKILISLLVLLILGLCLTYFLYSRHYLIRSVTRTFMYYEQSGDYGSSWEMLHSDMKAQMKQSTYVETKSQIYLNDFKAQSFSYKIEHIRHLSAWHPSNSSKTYDNVYEVTVAQSFDSQFGDETLTSQLFLARDKKNQSKWSILWDNDK
ncbi:hypothetical protein PU629_05115 [Pullulanibacillus sp. KACC 23026]|uniref:hypothetical protein n=1 Tax=Pullulanibacillus sp. KACC 23026 TaxID=3028315 RepID=UPI0023AFF25C|nr:hypothetical protein [Pullulanibacillus sp. KACC 23026]WEG13748.1 hypothetical protein PU629_05115 [Pullulanibacillus sp. KACC 23026]